MGIVKSHYVIVIVFELHYSECQETALPILLSDSPDRDFKATWCLGKVFISQIPETIDSSQ